MRSEPGVFNLDEKRWYVGVGDHSHGPFSWRELEAQTEACLYDKTALVWTSGMPEWRELGDLIEAGDFAAEVTHAPRSFEPLAYALPQTADFSFASESAPELTTQPAAQAPGVDLERRPSRARVWAAAALLVGAISSAVYFALPPSWVRPQGISQDDFAALTAAIEAGSAKRHGAQVALAVAESAEGQPRVFAGSNLPAGAVVEVHLEGVPETLVGAFQASLSSWLTLNGPLTPLPSLNVADRRPIPMGEYVLRVVHGQGEGRRVLAEKKLFLGGARDSNYGAQLKTYHALLRERAAGELDEIKQVAFTLEQQLNETSAQFKNAKASRRKWNTFHRQWLEMERQIQALFEGRDARDLRASFYYGSFYETLAALEVRVAGLHGRQAQAIADGTGGGDFEEIAGETAQLHRALQDLLDQAKALEKMAASSEMPLRPR